jgi:hypothetical protein
MGTQGAVSDGRVVQTTKSGPATQRKIGRHVIAKRATFRRCERRKRDDGDTDKNKVECDFASHLEFSFNWLLVVIG